MTQYSFRFLVFMLKNDAIKCLQQKSISFRFLWLLWEIENIPSYERAIISQYSNRWRLRDE